MKIKTNAVLDVCIIDISKRKLIMISDKNDPIHITWTSTENFMYLWNLLETIKHCTNISYVYSTTAAD
jgi:hypothetical protein